MTAFAEWLLEFLELAPTPAKASRLREATIANLLKRRRIRRLDARAILAALRRPPLQVAGGTIEAASAHVASNIPRIRLLNRQIKDADRRIETLTTRLAASGETEPGQNKQHDAEILASLPGVGRTVLATLLAEAWDALQRRGYAALRSLTGVAPVTKRSGKSCIVVRGRLATNASPTPSIIGRASPCSMILAAAPSTPRCANEVTRTAEPSAPSSTASSTLPAPGSNPAQPSTPPSPLKNRLINGGESPRYGLKRRFRSRLNALDGSLRPRLRHEWADSPHHAAEYGFVILRAILSPPAALHTASRRRSCLRLHVHDFTSGGLSPP